MRPIAAKERIETLDVLRGFAIFGILAVNILDFSGYSALKQQWAGTIDQDVGDLVWFFGRGKFFPLFIFLFGVGFALQLGRAKARGVRFFPLYGRRLLILLLFGLAHNLLDPLEVLFGYALLGFHLFLFRARSPKTLVVVALVCLLLPWVLQAVTIGLQELRQVDQPAAKETSQAEEAAKESTQEKALRLYSQGSLGEVVARHAQQLARRFSPIGYIWMLGAFPSMLLGLYAGRSQVFENLSTYVPFMRKARWWGLGVGLVGTTVAYLAYFKFTANLAWPYWWPIAGVCWSVGSLALSLFYASSIVLLVQREMWKRWATPFAAVGRVALTNYLLQTLICTTIFYGYGLGLYGKVGALYGFGLSVLIYALQILMSVWWIRRFRFGPAEWLWRTLTYGKLQPMRVPPSAA